MSGLNVYTFTGRLGADAELKYTQGGTPIWSARVAVDYGWGENKGTSWLNAKSLGKHAEALGKLELLNGAKIGGSGELQVREYDKRDGGKGTAIEVLVNNIALLGSKPGPAESPRARSTPQRSKPAAPAQDEAPFIDSDIPF